MSSFDIEYAFRRFLFLGVGGVVVILVLLLIVLYGNQTPAEAGSSPAVTNRIKPAPRSTPQSTVRTKTTPSRTSRNDKADSSPAASASDLPFPIAVIPPVNDVADTNPSAKKNAPNRPVRLIFVSANAAQSVRPEDGALFPKESCRVQIRYLDSEPGSYLTGVKSDNSYYNSYAREAVTEYFQNQLHLRRLVLYLRNGMLQASGELTAPVMLTFGDPMWR